jgi:hypothetical protein
VVADNNWHFLAVNFNGTTAEIIHDGTVVATSNTVLAGRSAFSTTNLRIGSTNSGTTKSVGLDEWIICNQGLTAGEWLEHYNRRL